MPDGIRIDKWLWYARFFKTRTLAQTQVSAGKIRVNGERISKANQTVRPGDVLTFVKARDVRVVEIVNIGDRRGPASEAQSLYSDLAPPSERKDRTLNPDDPQVATRDPGSGRPTKRERRITDRLRGQ